MRLKSELYKKEQLELCDKIIKILDLSDDNTFILYEMDNDNKKQEAIMKLLPELRKYFSYRNINGIREPEKTERAWLSIIRHVCKLKYTITSREEKQSRIEKQHRKEMDEKKACMNEIRDLQKRNEEIMKRNKKIQRKAKQMLSNPKIFLKYLGQNIQFSEFTGKEKEYIMDLVILLNLHKRGEKTSIDDKLVNLHKCNGREQK